MDDDYYVTDLFVAAALILVGHGMTRLVPVRGSVHYVFDRDHRLTESFVRYHERRLAVDARGFAETAEHLETFSRRLIETEE